ncbi:TetR/AcrR family transcriptional regulator [Novosphingobium sp.]|uniref:TetR/AcrR family transcriptional regulator n=1 Tax=Novosphingobium sp. TaxID=1874826 RepID=UPI003D148FEA
MIRRRISGPERKALILDHARHAFAKFGFEATRTQDIARAAQVSEALVYRHFPTKQALYRAVLRRAIREQNANHDIIGLKEITARGLITNLRVYLKSLSGMDQRKSRKVSGCCWQAWRAMAALPV